MAKLMTEPVFTVTGEVVNSSASSFCKLYKSSRIRASQPRSEKKNSYKQLGMFALRKKMEDSIRSAELLASTALEQEEVRRTKQEEVIRECNLWDDVAQAYEILVELAESDEVVDSLKDIRYKAEEAKLIMELLEMDAINDGLFKQAYTVSTDLSKFLKRYEMSKYLKEPFDKQGACMAIEYGEGIYNEQWAEQLARMYIKWAEKQGHGWRRIEKFSSKGVGTKSAILEFESKFVYGYLKGETGIHRMMSMSQDGSISSEASIASVDVIPLFLESAPNIVTDNKDVVISSSSPGVDDLHRIGSSVHILHIPTGFTMKSTGERSVFANKMKALNRLNAKLLSILKKQRVSTIEDINRVAIFDELSQERRRYVFHPTKLVDDVRTGIKLTDLSSVLNGNIEPLIAAHISHRHSTDTF